MISQALFGAATGVGLLSVFGLVALGLASLGLRLNGQLAGPASARIF